MVKGRKITKKKLKEPDEFITVTERTFLFVKKHLKKVAAGGIALLVIVLAIFVFQLWERKSEAEAYQRFGLAIEVYEKASSTSREESTGEYKNAHEKFDELIVKYPRTSPGRFALLYRGNIGLKLGKYEEAIKDYSAFLDKAGKERLFRYFALDGLGHAYEGKKDYEKAVQSYQKIIEMGDGFQLADASLSMGICYEKLGKAKEALESYKSYLKSAPKSVMTNTVLRRVSLLEK